MNDIVNTSITGAVASDDVVHVATSEALELATVPQVAIGGIGQTPMGKNNDEEDFKSKSDEMYDNNQLESEGMKGTTGTFAVIKKFVVNNDKHWSKWNSNELMGYLQQEMFKDEFQLRANEKACVLFLADLNKQQINGATIKLLKENAEFEKKLEAKMDHHPFAVWIVFQTIVANFEEYLD